MAVTVQSFKSRNAFFAARDSSVIDSAITTARLHYSESVCGELYDPLVEAKVRVLLLAGQKGGPTSKTKESGFAAEAQATLESLEALIPARGAVLGGS